MFAHLPIYFSSFNSQETLSEVDVIGRWQDATEIARGSSVQTVSFEARKYAENGRLVIFCLFVPARACRPVSVIDTGTL